MTWLFALALPILKKLVIWLIGIFIEDAEAYVEKSISDWKTARAAALAAKKEKAALNDPKATPQEKKDAESNLLNS